MPGFIFTSRGHRTRAQRQRLINNIKKNTKKPNKMRVHYLVDYSM